MEKRKKLRTKKRYMVRFECNQNSHMGYTADISEDGIYILTHHTYPLGTRIDIEIEGKDKKIKVSGTVVRYKKVPINYFHALKGGIGVKLDKDLSPDFQLLFD